MVTITKDANRADLAECMSHMTAATAALARRGHEGKHKSCEDCDRYGVIHANLNALLTSWEQAEDTPDEAVRRAAAQVAERWAPLLDRLEDGR